LAAHLAVGHLHAATVADDVAVLDALVLAAEALPVPRGTEDLLAEEAVLLGAVRAVVDGLGLLHLAERPAADVLRRSELHRDAGVVVHAMEDVDVEHLGRSFHVTGPAAAGRTGTPRDPGRARRSAALATRIRITSPFGDAVPC